MRIMIEILLVLSIIALLVSIFSKKGYDNKQEKRKSVKLYAITSLFLVLLIKLMDIFSF